MPLVTLLLIFLTGSDVLGGPICPPPGQAPIRPPSGEPPIRPPSGEPQPSSEDASPALGALAGRVRLAGGALPGPTAVENTTDPANCGQGHTLEDLLVSAESRGTGNVILSLSGVPVSEVPPVEPRRVDRSRRRSLTPRGPRPAEEPQRVNEVGGREVGVQPEAEGRTPAQGVGVLVGRR